MISVTEEIAPAEEYDASKIRTKCLNYLDQRGLAAVNFAGIMVR